MAVLCAVIFLGAGCAESAGSVPIDQAKPATQAPTVEPASSTQIPAAVSKTDASPQTAPSFFAVKKVVDGDTFDVDIDGSVERIRVVGINTPETVDPRKSVECFGKESSEKAHQLLEGRRVRLEADASQDDRDKYGRLLRFVFLEDGTDYGLKMIGDGYAYEYTYDIPYKFQKEYKAAEKSAKDNGLGLWAAATCAGSLNMKAEPAPVTGTPVIDTDTMSSSAPSASCVIKGNISSGGKIYHLPGCASYDKTVIDVSAGERWFCTEAEAAAAGWRKAKNCP